MEKLLQEIAAKKAKLNELRPMCMPALRELQKYYDD